MTDRKRNVLAVLVVALGVWAIIGAPGRPRPGVTPRDLPRDAPPTSSTGLAPSPAPPVVRQPPNTAPPETHDAGLRGIVRSEVDREPVAGASLFLTSDGRPLERGGEVGTTGSDGRFVIPRPPSSESKFVLNVARVGFLPWSQLVRADAEDMEVLLSTGGSIAGRVVDQRGTAVAGAVVAGTSDVTSGLWPEDEDALAGPPWRNGFRAVTDTDGRFRATGLEERDEYELHVRPPPGYAEDARRAWPRVRAGDPDVTIPVLARSRLRLRIKDGTTGEAVEVLSTEVHASHGLRFAGEPSLRRPAERSRVGTTEPGVVDSWVAAPGEAEDAAQIPIRVKVTAAGYVPQEVVISYLPGKDAETEIRLQAERDLDWVEVTPRASFPGGAPLDGRFALVITSPPGSRGSQAIVTFRSGVAERPLRLPRRLSGVRVQGLDEAGVLLPEFDAGTWDLSRDASAANQPLVLPVGRVQVTVRSAEVGRVPHYHLQRRVENALPTAPVPLWERLASTEPESAVTLLVPSGPQVLSVRWGNRQAVDTQVNVPDNGTVVPVEFVTP